MTYRYFQTTKLLFLRTACKIIEVMINGVVMQHLSTHRCQRGLCVINLSVCLAMFAKIVGGQRLKCDQGVCGLRAFGYQPNRSWQRTFNSAI